MGIQDAKQAVATAAPVNEPTAVATAGALPVPNYYCLDKRHASRLVTVERFFRWDGERYPQGHARAGQLVMIDQGSGQPAVPVTSTCPVCAVCTAQDQNNIDPLTGRPREARVSCIPLEYDDQGNPLIPASVLSIAARAGEA
jgi:hypothetical protein